MKVSERFFASTFDKLGVAGHQAGIAVLFSG
jgi:hypothetical protein